MKISTIMLLQTKWIIWYAIFLHLTWGVLFMLDAAATQGTGPAALLHLFHGHRRLAAAALLTVALLATLPMLHSRSEFVDLILLLPQQLLLLVAAQGAITAAVHSAYADGVIRPKAFILADQMPGILVVLAHTAAITQPFYVRWFNHTGDK